MKKNYKIRLLILLFSISALIASCKKFVEVGAPITSTNGENVYNNDATAISVLSGMYANVTRGASAPNFAQGNKSISMLCGLSADEFTLWSGGDALSTGYYTNNLIVDGIINIGSDFWNPLYNYVFVCNTAIEGLNSTKSLTTSVQRQLLGEAKFMRAFFYFYLVNLFGDVPLITTTDYTKNAVTTRSAKSEVYQQIITDLKEAQELLSEDFLDANLIVYSGMAERVRPTKWAATALLGRVYLYTNDYANAEEQSTILISRKTMFSLASINDVFKKNSIEAIWQLQPVNSGFNTEDARTFVIPTAGFSNTNPVRLSNYLLNQFESSDNRKKIGNWVSSIILSNITYYYPYKYKINTQNSSVTSTSSLTEYLMVLRLAEQYLIRAEARAQLGKIQDAQSDLNEIRIRAGLATLTLVDKTSLLNAIFKERQLELFSEWGHRWFDLKRTGLIDEVMKIATPGKANGAEWKSYQQFFPVPYVELQRNPFLEQTAGY